MANRRVRKNWIDPTRTEDDFINGQVESAPSQDATETSQVHEPSPKHKPGRLTVIVDYDTFLEFKAWAAQSREYRDMSDYLRSCIYKALHGEGGL